ncbi:MAG: hypothetical protein Q8M04_02760 [Pseudomonadota bacterium]|nr:hypothetical protein [Pseudomonadota bacterium]
MDAFIESAGRPFVAAVEPWVGRDDARRIEVFNLRLTAMEKEKLAYIVANSKYKSMQEFCIHVLRPAIDAEAKRLAGSEGNTK